MAEKRSSRRWSQRLRVNVWEYGHDRPIVGYTENVSGGGMFLSMADPLRAGARVRLEVVADEQTFFAEGVVAHVRRVPRELQKVKQAGVGVRLLPFECFLQDVRPSGTTMTASGVWRMGTEAPQSASAQPESRERSLSGRSGGRPSTATRPSAALPSTSSRPPGKFSRENPHERVSSAKVTLHTPPSPPAKTDDGLLYPVRFDDTADFLRRYQTDVRMGIFFVLTRAPAPQGTRVVLEISPPGARRPLRLPAEVVRGGQVGDGGAGETSGMLVRFVEPSAAIDALGIFARALSERGRS